VVWGELCSKFLTQSQVFVLLFQFRRLEQTANLGPALKFGCLRRRLLLLLLHEVQFGIVARKLSEGDDKIAEGEPELVVLCVQCEQAFNKGCDLTSVVCQQGCKTIQAT